MTTPLKVDVEALLREAANVADTSVTYVARVKLIGDLATALRASQDHLRAVLDFFAPNVTFPVVRDARAFLAGEEQVLQEADLETVLDDAEQARDCYRRKHLAACERISVLAREKAGLEKELADKSATLERMVERHERVTRELSRMTNDRNEWKAVADAIGPAFQNDLTKLRAQLATEDEAQTHLRARLAEVERERDGFRDALKFEREFRSAQSNAAVAALAAQNRAESEAASLRSEVTDLRRKVSEGETLVESLIAWAKKGRA